MLRVFGDGMWVGAWRPVGMRQRSSGLALVAALLLSSPAFADEPAAAASAASDAEKSVECPYLTQVRYPFIRCEKDAMGNVVFDSAPQTVEGLRIPKMDSFIEGPGYWGS